MYILLLYVVIKTDNKIKYILQLLMYMVINDYFFFLYLPSYTDSYTLLYLL